jgi:hypothetical protein
VETRYSDYVPFSGYDFQSFQQTPFRDIAYPTQPVYYGATQPAPVAQPAPTVQNVYGLDGFQVFDQNAPQPAPVKQTTGIENVYYAFNPYGE